MKIIKNDDPVIIKSVEEIKKILVSNQTNLLQSVEIFLILLLNVIASNAKINRRELFSTIIESFLNLEESDFFEKFCEEFDNVQKNNT